MFTQTRKFRIGGYQPGQKPDDVKHHQIGRFGKEELPGRVDLRHHMTEVEAQVGNSCVANAFVGAYEYLAKRDLGDAGNVSRLFVYYNARSQTGSHNEDAGTQMRCAIETLMQHGACSEDLWPNDEELIFTEPDTGAYDHASNFKIVETETIDTDLDLWRHTLAEGYPIAFALNTFESFDEATRNKGRVPQPKRSDNVRETHGWHAMLCVGYSDKDRFFIVRNSWGPEWGDRGYCYIPYDYVIHDDYNGHDSWIIKSLSDLDFSAEVWEEDESFFADECSLLLYDFYIHTEDPEGFTDALAALCLTYVETEDDYYFDYDYNEDEGSPYLLNILNFDLSVEDGTEFVAELDALCQEYAVDESYSFGYGSSDEEATEEDEAVEESEEEYAEEESEEEYAEEESEEEYTEEESEEEEYSEEEEEEYAEEESEEEEYSEEEE
ncbi:C1 family peptidase [Nodosilinea sp. FACHB-13]|uniref:C1 family peptidase n=1 Tax=Cyanophyceae TaxID=3028117 RepID=UPI0016869E09|nr:C1 family peptidase [Nodosilinea sp. FACHB-13]MBD2108148.1 C1 family peptidase [Nodosilinea sp. FACHB-13]